MTIGQSKIELQNGKIPNHFMNKIPLLGNIKSRRGFELMT